MAYANPENGPPMYKNKLQEHAQKLELPFPVYQNMNEGYPHAPKFRARVVIEGKTFTSSLTYPDLRAAEQEAAKIAYECLTRNSRIQDRAFVHQACQNPRLSFGLKPIFCKSILHEYAIKVNLKIPKYHTTCAVGSHPVFISSFELGGKTYRGEEARSKKVAEQLVARNAIQSLLRSDTGRLADIIKSKERIYSPSKAKKQPSEENKSTVAPQFQSEPDYPVSPETSIQTDIIGYDAERGRIVYPKHGIKRKFEGNSLDHKKKNVRA